MISENGRGIPSEAKPLPDFGPIPLKVRFSGLGKTRGWLQSFVGFGPLFAGRAWPHDKLPGKENIFMNNDLQTESDCEFELVELKDFPEDFLLGGLHMQED